MTTIRLEPVGSDTLGLKAALTEARLPTDDIDDTDRSFFMGLAEDGAMVGYSGLEACGGDCLLRSLVLLPEHRRKGLGRILAQRTLEEVADGADVYLATTTAVRFFDGLGFAVVGRTEVPEAVLSTRQLSGLCPATASIMKRIRPPT